LQAQFKVRDAVGLLSQPLTTLGLFLAIAARGARDGLSYSLSHPLTKYALAPLAALVAVGYQVPGAHVALLDAGYVRFAELWCCWFLFIHSFIHSFADKSQQHRRGRTLLLNCVVVSSFTESNNSNIAAVGLVLKSTHNHEE
jgi:hypothetical protein